MLEDLMAKATDANYASSIKPLEEKIRETFPTLIRGVEHFIFHDMDWFVHCSEGDRTRWGAVVDGVLLAHTGDCYDWWLAALFPSTAVGRLIVRPPVDNEGVLTGFLSFAGDSSIPVAYELFSVEGVDPEIALADAIKRLQIEKEGGLKRSPGGAPTTIKPN